MKFNAQEWHSDLTWFTIPGLLLYGLNDPLGGSLFEIYHYISSLPKCFWRWRNLLQRYKYMNEMYTYVEKEEKIQAIK